MMEIREFVAKFKNCRENEREKFIEKHILKDKYVPYAEKIDTCKAIVNTSCYKKIKTSDGEKTFFKLDSPARYFSYCILTDFLLWCTEIFTDNRLHVSQPGFGEFRANHRGSNFAAR